MLTLFCRITLTAWFLLSLSWSQALAFHNGGSASCAGCHVVHGTVVSSQLLNGQSPSDVCLSCHEKASRSQQAVSTTGSQLGPGLAPLQLTPGGDFAWLKKTYSWIDQSLPKQELGERHGHNVVAPDHGYFQDQAHVVAPRGTFPSSALQCTSCHDPHGRYRISADGTTQLSGSSIGGSSSMSADASLQNPTAAAAVGSYRLLAGQGYRPPGTAIVFTADPPAAIAPADVNQSESDDQVRVAYGSGLSAWCSNCHGFTASGSQFVHHTQEKVAVPFGLDEETRYNAYIKTGVLTGLAATSFLSLVPFETGSTNDVAGRSAMALLASTDSSQLSGPSSGASVSCLSCHRAHASGWKSALRWNPSSEFLTWAGQWPGAEIGAPSDRHLGRNSAEIQQAYYGRNASDFAMEQRPLCEKCHDSWNP